MLAQRAYTLWTPEDERKLRELWRQLESDRQKYDLLARRLERTKESIRGKAVELGLCGRRYQWSDKDLKYLRLLISNGTTQEAALHKVRQRFEERGDRAPCVRVIKRQLRLLSQECEHYSAIELAEILNCTPELVRRWFLDYKKTLKPKHRGKFIFVRREHLRSFFLKYPGEVAKTKPDLVWLIEFLKGEQND